LCVCVCVCAAHVRVYVSMLVCTQACIHTFECLCMCVHVCMHGNVCVCVFVCACGHMRARVCSDDVTGEAGASWALPAAIDVTGALTSLCHGPYLWKPLHHGSHEEEERQ
jgi:hypothetical protein